MSQIGAGVAGIAPGLRRILALSPADGRSWRDIGLSDGSGSALSRAASILTDDPDVYGSLGSGALATGDHRYAGRHLGRALALMPGRADLLQLTSHWSYCRRNAGDAARWARRALAFDPGFVAARRSLHFAELLEGNLASGAAALGVDLRTIPAVPLPLWRGEPLNGRSLLVVGEEGFGDMIQMARFLPLLARSGAKVTVVVPPALRRLFASLADVGVAVEASPAQFDAWIPMMALPAAMPDRLGAGLPVPPYLTPPPTGPELAPSTLFTVGLTWKGRPSHPFDRRRSLTPPLLAPLLAVAGVRFVSLDPENGLPPLLGVPQSDFADTAFLMSQLDLVISVDTASAHLGGALGVPTWVLVADLPEWRWGTDGRASPWYPGARLYRCPTPSDWPDIVAAVARDLTRLASRGTSVAT